MIANTDNSTDLPRYHKRAFAHNYCAPFIYHIIIKKQDGVEKFGTVAGDARIAPGKEGCAHVVESELGKIIAKEIVHMQYSFPILQIYQYVVMPDHVHILLRVKEWSNTHLDFYINTLKANVQKRYMAIGGENNSGEEIFQQGYCDKPLLLNRKLDDLFTYIRENPHRLAMRQQLPQFFQRTRNLKIGGAEYQAYGNLFLIRNPDKDAVKISSKFTPEEKLQKREQWMSNVKKGTILVSPFISKAEKEVRAEAEGLGGKVILIIPQEFGERYKPAAHDFALCCQGRLLIISLGLPAATPLSRELCQRMNSLAAEIAAPNNN